MSTLEKLKNNLKKPLDEKLAQVVCNIFDKPERKYAWDGTDLKPRFMDSLVKTLQQSYYKMTEEKAKLCIENTRNKITKNLPRKLPIEKCIETELLKHIDRKIANRVEKIELLEAIVESFHERVQSSQPRKKARFGKVHPYIEDLIE